MRTYWCCIKQVEWSIEGHYFTDSLSDLSMEQNEDNVEFNTALSLP